MTRRNRLVRFGKIARVKLVLHINDYSQEEREQSWYTQNDMEGFEIDSKINKKVLFSSIASARRVLRRCDYTQEEYEATWYTQEDLQKFDQELKDEDKVVDAFVKSIPELREDEQHRDPPVEPLSHQQDEAEPVVDYQSLGQCGGKDLFGVSAAPQRGLPIISPETSCSRAA